MRLVIFSQIAFPYNFFVNFQENQAKLSFLDDSFISVNIENRYVKDLNKISVAGLISSKYGHFCLDYNLQSNFGTYEHKLGLAYIRKFSPRFAATLNFRPVLLHFENQRQFNLDIENSYWIKLHSQVFLTADIHLPINIYNTKFSLFNSSIILGLEYLPVKNLLTRVAIKQNLLHKAQFSLSLCYSFSDKFSVLAGMENLTFFAGFGTVFKKFQITLTSKYVQNLGFETRLGLAYSLRNK
jgi:hypothetical protein